MPTLPNMKTRIISTLFLFFLVSNSFAQGKTMDESVYDTWNRISRSQISQDGQWVSYQLGPENEDQDLNLYSVKDKKTYTFPRGTSARFAASNSMLVFQIKPQKDSIRALKRKKVKKKDFPKDTLAIYDFKTKTIQKIPNIKSFKIGEYWDSHLAYHLADKKKVKPSETKQDSTQTEKKKKKLEKKESKKNGSRLVIRDLNTNSEDTLAFVTTYTLAKRGPGIAAISTGAKKNEDAVSVYDFNQKKWKDIYAHRGKYSQLAFADRGDQLVFIADKDTTEAQVRPYEMFYWKNGRKCKKIADANASFLPQSWSLSNDKTPRFTEKGDKLIFDIKAPAVVQDTSLIEEEIVQVEVWNYKDGRLHTQQEVMLNDMKKEGFDVIWHIDQNKFVPLASPEIPNIRWDAYEAAEQVVGLDNSKYLQNISWLGYANNDVYLIDTKKGESKLIASNIDGNPRLSPKGKYVYWYTRRDTCWVAYDVKKEKLRILTDRKLGNFFDETNDRPMLPRADGLLGWTENDDRVLLYDGYDIWSFNPKKEKKGKRLTKGRENNSRYRYLKLDGDEKFVYSKKPLFLYAFNEKDKSSGYSFLNLTEERLESWTHGPLRYGFRPQKGRRSNNVLFTKESFIDYPDLHITTDSFRSNEKITEANPQQKEYNWGNIELFDWTSFEGNQLQGMVVKPDNFDPSKKYPLIVNFYEKSSDRLHAHRPPFAGRSTISYSFYANKGYVIFNPDVLYTNGYPGNSCYDAVISGIEALLKEGFIDKDKIGVQGHSWGGYQVAHLLTKTDIFKCAESGAPVVNMISAYGGIRWRSGMSRMFQYEKTQSRLGATLWENPEVYVENSPIFNTDKVNTPVLILHNDKDGAVPWYQGIEYFVALRRLGKPAWLLNYNDEPHWPVKRQNRVDFQTRMAQFFDHYLMDKPMPKWMDEGVSAMDKGINQGLELIEEDGSN